MEINQIICSDCMEIMKEMPDNFVDVTITSPPYNVSNSNYECVSDSKYLDYKDNMDVEEYYNFISKRLIEIIRVTKKYVFFNIQMLSGNKIAFLRLLSDFKNQIKDIIIWVKKNPAPNISPYVLSKSYEFILVFDKENQTGAYNKDKNIKRCIPDTIIKSVNSDNKHTKEHKAVFPNWLPQHFIKNFSDKDDVIFDPFNGIGTTTYYAKMLNRRYIGIDINLRYCDISKNRLLQTKLNGGQLC